MIWIIHTNVYIHDSVLDCHFILVSNDCIFFLYLLKVLVVFSLLRGKERIMDFQLITDQYALSLLLPFSLSYTLASNLSSMTVSNLN